MTIPDNTTAEELAKFMLDQDLTWYEPSIGFICASNYLDIVGWTLADTVDAFEAAKIRALIPAADRLIKRAKEKQ